MVPFITREIKLWSTCLLVSTFVLEFGVQIDSVKQPTYRNSVGSGHVSHRNTSALYDHFEHSFIIFKNVQLSFEMRRTCGGVNVIHI